MYALRLEASAPVMPSVFPAPACRLTVQSLAFGIYTHPDERGKGSGTRCLSQLSRILLARARSLCVLVNEQNPKAARFYRKAGYKLRGYCDTIYLQEGR